MNVITTDEFIKSVLSDVSEYIENDKLVIFESCLYKNLKDITLQKETTAITTYANKDKEMYRRFFLDKKISGRSDKTLAYYRIAIDGLLNAINKPLIDISSDDIKYFLAVKQIKRAWTAVTANNNRRAWNSFFNFLCEEDYIPKNPMVRVKNIKEPKLIKKEFTEIEVEKMREILNSEKTSAFLKKRNIAIFETLLSTGCRVGELVTMPMSDEVSDIMFVIGKGNKERKVYLNAKAKLAIKAYIAERNKLNADNNYLFISRENPYNRLTIGAVETMIRSLGSKAGIENVHPHKFRRTFATWGLKRGIPIEQVKQLLGHESIETTTIYAKSDDTEVKISHDKYLS